jgi:hypothetical protein
MHRRVPGKSEAFGTMTRLTVLSLTVLTTICLIASCSTAQQLPANSKPLSAENKIWKPSRKLRSTVPVIRNASRPW